MILKNIVIFIFQFSGQHLYNFQKKKTLCFDTVGLFSKGVSL